MKYVVLYINMWYKFKYIKIDQATLEVINCNNILNIDYEENSINLNILFINVTLKEFNHETITIITKDK